MFVPEESSQKAGRSKARQSVFLIILAGRRNFASGADAFVGRLPVPSTGVAAPASAVDDVMEKFGRPRARSLSRHDRRMSLPAWEEESDDGLPEAVEPLKERRRTMSMSAAEGFCGRQPRRQVAAKTFMM